MSQPSYDQLKPLIAQELLRGSTVHVMFQCPVSGQHAESSAPVREGGASKAMAALKRNAMSQLRWALANTVRSALGGGYFGRVGSGMVHEAAPGGSAASAPSTAQRQAAVVEAFQRVQSQFTWDGAHQRYLHASAVQGQQSAFARALAGLQLGPGQDKNVLTRMLAEVAGADGHIADEERELFDAFAGDHPGGVEALLALPLLSPADLATVGHQLREPLLMLAWAVAYADEELEPAEQARLQAFAQGFGLGRAQVQRAAGAARDHAYAVGWRLGLDQQAVQQLEARCMQRRGLA